jgi:hypothetical protein
MSEDRLAAKSAAFVRAAIHAPPNQPTFDLSRRQQTFLLLEPDTRVDAIITTGGMCLPRANRHSEFSQSRIRGRG